MGLGSKRNFKNKAIERLQNGLIKLQKTASDVAALEEELKIEQDEAEVQKASANELMERVGLEKAKVGGEVEKAQIEAGKCEKLAENCNKFQKECFEDLARAEPAVAKAMAALDTLNKKD